MNTIKNTTLKTLVAGLLLSLTACSALDLRTDKMKREGSSEQARVAGNSELQKMSLSHGFEKWLKLQTTSIDFVNQWKSVMARMMGFNIWDKEHKVSFLLKNNSADVKLKVADDNNRVERYGYFQGKFYRLEQNRVQWRQDQTSQFLIRTWSWLFELPFRITKAPLIARMADGVFQNKTYTRVFVTWNKFEAHLEADQYVLWIDQETNRLKIAEYTVREQMRSLRGTAYFDDYRENQGLLFPYQITVTENLSEGYQKEHLQQMKISQVQYDRAYADSLNPEKK